MRMERRFILWDHDGVLVDTERWYYRATKEALVSLGVDLDEATYLEFQARGQPCWDLVESRATRAEVIDRQRRRRNEIYQEYLRTESIEIDGVAEVLSELSERFRMAVVTTSRRQDFDLIHESRSILEFLEFILTVEDYPRTKPHPDPYQAALQRFGAAAEEAVAVEDSARGLRSAVSAGIDCAIVTNSFTASQDFSGAWRIVDSIRALPALLREWPVP